MLKMPRDICIHNNIVYYTGLLEYRVDPFWSVFQYNPEFSCNEIAQFSGFPGFIVKNVTYEYMYMQCPCVQLYHNFSVLTVLFVVVCVINVCQVVES